MALDFNQISARLTRLPDDALSAFARQHMSNYSIMSLVANELSRRKGIRDAAALKMAGTPPPVNEQLVASLSSGQAPTQGGAGGTGPAALPENQGLGRLPIKTAYGAEGGIVGYADGGVARFNGRTESNVADLWAETDTRRDPEVSASSLTGVPLAPPVNERLRNWWAGRASPASAAPMVPTAPAAPASTSAGDERRAAAEALNALTPLTSRGGVGVGSIPKPINVYAPENVSKAMETVPKRDTIGGLAELKSRQATHTEDVAAARRRYEAGLPTGEVGEEAMARYKKETEADPTRRKEAFYMALVQAGLGMMASTSPNTLQAIASGAQGGFDAYRASMKDLDSLADTRNKAMDAISQARRAEKQGRAEKALAFDNEQANLMAKYGMDSWKFLQEQAGLDRQESLMFALKSLDEAGANQRAYQQMLLQVRLHGDRKGSDALGMARTILQLKAAGRPEAVEQLISAAQMAATGKRDPMSQRKLAAEIIDKRKNSDINYAMELQKPGRYEAELNAQLAAMGAASPAGPAGPAVPGITVEAARYTNP